MLCRIGHAACPCVTGATRVQDESVSVLLNGFGTVITALGKRAKPYLPQINGTIKWRLNHKLPRTRQQAADLIARIAIVMKQCGEERLLTHLGIVLYENIGEEYPEARCCFVLSVLWVLRALLLSKCVI